MKTIYIGIYCMLLCIISTTVLAQEKLFHFGIKGGLNLSYLSFDNNNVPNSKLFNGGNIGLTTTYGLSDLFSLQSGLFLTTKGGTVSDKSSIGFDIVIPGEEEAMLKSRQVYLQLPVYLRYRIKTNKGIDFILNVGPYFAQGIAGYTKLNATILHGDAIYRDEIKEKTFGDRGLKKFDWGIGVGIGIDLKEVVVGLNYELGLKNIGPDGKVYFPFYNSSYKNRNISLSLEYKL